MEDQNVNNLTAGAPGESPTPPTPVTPTEPGTVTEGAVTPPAATKELSPAEKRIQEVIAQRKEETAKRIKAEQEAAYYKGLAEGGTRGAAPATPETPAPPAPPAEDLPPVKPNPKDFETYEAYEEAKDGYNRSVVRWEMRQESKKTETANAEKAKREKAKADAQALRQKWEGNLAKAVAAKPDLIAAISDPKFVQSPALAFLLQDSNVGPDVAYHLAMNPAELAEMNALPQHEIAKRFGLLEQKVKGTSAPVEPPRKIQSEAPPPAAPIAPGPGLAPVSEQDLPIDQFMAQRNAREAKGEMGR